MEKSYVTSVANTILQQIVNSVDASVFFSWGVHGCWSGVVHYDGTECPFLLLDVHGLMHDGYVVVALDEGKDLYMVKLLDRKMQPKCDWHTDVYCDELGRLIDSLVEKPSDMSDGVYDALSTIDSLMKMLDEKDD